MPFDSMASRFIRWAHRGVQVVLILSIWLLAQGLWPDWIAALESAAWLFVLYMLARVVLILAQNPRAFTYVVPELAIPARVTAVSLPRLANPLTPHEQAVWDLIVILRKKISNAADEASVHALMHERIANLKSLAYARFSEVSRELNTLAFEGIIGTLLGMMVFMAQASKLLDLPPMDSDPTTLAQALMHNLTQIDFLVVLCAFITSVIGWTGKAWIGRAVDHRRAQELDSLTSVEFFLQTEILARLSLPGRTILAHTLSADTWVSLAQGQLKLRVLHIDGGLLLEPVVDEPVGIFFEDVTTGGDV